MKNISLSMKRLIVIAAVIACAILPQVSGRYLVHLLMLTMINVILGVSLNITLGYLGQPHFGHAASFGIGAYTLAILSVHYHAPMYISFLGSGLSGLLAGYVLGYISLQLRGAYFCMVSIAITQVLLLLSGNLIGLTGGPMGISGMPNPNPFGLGPYGLWLIGMAVVLTMLGLTKRFSASATGRAWIAIRESETLARSVGVDSFRYALMAYVVGSGCASLGGFIYIHYIGYLDPSIFAFAWSSLAVVVVVIGGRGILLGPVVGAVIITLLPEYLRIAALWRLPMFGAVVILIVLFVPNGLLSLIERYSARRQSSGERVA